MPENIFLLIGFVIAAYAIVANDSIQTLGTFLASNRKRKWWWLWGYLMLIFLGVLWYGWWRYGGDVSYGRLNKIPDTINPGWWVMIAPITLLVLTRFAIPVSTTFIILVTFASKALDKMLVKSLLGYAVAFVVALLLYFLIRKLVVDRSNKAQPPKGDDHVGKQWIVLQWLSTGFLWSQWLIQDLANIFVYFPRQISAPALLIASAVMVVLYGVLIRQKGGNIQKIVTSKTQTTEIKAATLIDLLFGVILFIFKEVSDIPMSTTWVFLGLLAGREIAINGLRKMNESGGEKWRQIGTDLGKAAFGVAISVLIALLVAKLS